MVFNTQIGRFSTKFAASIALVCLVGICGQTGFGSAAEINLPQQPTPFSNLEAIKAAAQKNSQSSQPGVVQSESTTSPTLKGGAAPLTPASQKKSSDSNSQPSSPFKQEKAVAGTPAVPVRGNIPAEPASMLPTNTAKSSPLKKSNDLEPWQNNELSASTFGEMLSTYKEIVDEKQKQTVTPNKRTFVELSRNYLNRITCEGKIENMVIPQDRGMEAQILNDNHDLFLRVGAVDIKQFPLDMSLVCDGQVYLINAVVHPNVPSQDITLVLPKGVRPLSVQQKAKYQKAIQHSEALPLEEQVSKIMQRVYSGDFLAYWKEIDTPTAESRWTLGSFSVLLQKVISTNINDLIAWDFVFRGRVPAESLYDTIRKVVRGEIVAYGRVTYESQGALRVIVLTKQQ